jgi:hypothetical protein
MEELDDFQAIHFWHEDIHEDQIHLFVLQETQAVWPTFCGQDMVPCPFEHDLEEHPHLCFVINEEDSRHRSSHPFPSLLANYTTRILCSCSEMGKGRLLAEWPGERTDDRASAANDGKTLLLARGVPGARLKRWKVGSTNRTIAKQQEALIKTDLMMGTIKSEHVQGPTSFDAHTERYLAAPQIKKQAINGKLLPVLGGKLVTTITPGMIEEYRATRRMEKGLLGRTVKIATINRDLALLNHLFNFAIRDGCLEKNPVRLVKFVKENNACDRVLSPEEFEQLQSHSALHLQAINLMAY